MPVVHILNECRLSNNFGVIAFLKVATILHFSTNLDTSGPLIRRMDVPSVFGNQRICSARRNFVVSFKSKSLPTL
jgi:hypothetical protein